MTTQTAPRTSKHRATEPVAFPRPAADPAHRASRAPRLVGALIVLAILFGGLAVLVYRR